MKIFLSYSSKDRTKAEGIALALEGMSHDVFFDHDDLKGGENYNEVIHREIRSADLFVFLISPNSVHGGAYTLTELRLAREKWPHPKGAVLPVLLAPTPLADVPAYLKSVTILEPEGNVAAEVAARVAALKSRARVVPMLIGAVVLAGIAGVIAFTLLTPSDEAPWDSSIEAREFLSRYVYPNDAMVRSDYDLDGTFSITGAPDSAVYVSRWAYGSLSDTAAAMSITVRYRNITSEPMNVDFDHRFYRLEDDQGRRATLVYFCCKTSADLLPAGSEREMQLIFTAHPEWSGKEIQAHQINLRVTGLLPVTSGTWTVPALATAHAP